MTVRLKNQVNFIILCAIKTVSDIFYRSKSFLVLGEHNELKNRYCHIRAENLPVNLPVNKTQKIILDLLKINPKYTYDELAEKSGKTRETVRVNLRKLEELGLISRVGADKNGYWEIIEK